MVTRCAAVDFPPEEFKQSLLAAGMPDWSADALLEIFEYVAKPPK